MTKLTESELMASYDHTLAPSRTTVESTQPLRPMHAASRICKRGHLVPNGGKCLACNKLYVRTAPKRLSKRSRCDMGHPMVESNVIKTKRIRADGSSYIQRNCLACAEARESRKQAKGRSPRGTRALGISQVAMIDERILSMVDSIELMSTYELNQWRAERAELTKQRDGLCKKFNIG